MALVERQTAQIAMRLRHFMRLRAGLASGVRCFSLRVSLASDTILLITNIIVHRRKPTGQFFLGGLAIFYDLCPKPIC